MPYFFYLKKINTIFVHKVNLDILDEYSYNLNKLLQITTNYACYTI